MKKFLLKNRPAVFLIAMACLASGLLGAYIEQTFTGISAGLSISGGILLLACLTAKLWIRDELWIRDKQARSAFNSRRWKAISAVVAIITCSVAILVAINYAAYQSPIRWDVTAAQQHTLNADTVEFIHDLALPVKLTALTVGLPPKYLEDMFKEYERQSGGKITTEIIDPIEQIAYAAKFETVIRGDESKVIVQAGDQRRVVDFSNDPLSEEELSNAIVRITRQQRQVYFLVGHGEYSMTSEEPRGLSTLVALLEDNNIHSSELMLGTAEKIPDDCDVLIIAGPSNELSEHEQGLIAAYLNQGGDALILIEHLLVTHADKPLNAAQQDKNPSLNKLLNLWGIHVNDDIVVDLASHVGGDAGSPATRNYGNHKALTEGLDYTFYVRPRSISVLDNYPANLKLAPVVMTSSKDKSWGETNRNLDVHFDEGIDNPGPVVLSYVIWKEKTNEESTDTRLIVFSDADFLSNAYITQYSNAAMGLNVINWISELDYRVFIDQKFIRIERLNLTSEQKRMIIALLFLLPFIIFVWGIWVWMRR